MANVALIQSIAEFIGRLKDVKKTSANRHDLDEIISNYRFLFGPKYEKNQYDDVIASEVGDPKTKSFYKFLRSNYCCWIDFIGSDTFSCDNKNQVFFSTVSMSKNDLRRRRYFLKEYEDCLKTTSLPVDVFVQLFFKDINSFEEDLGVRNTLKVPAKEIVAKLQEIQSRGFLVSFEKGSTTKMSDDIVVKEIICPSPMPIGSLCINKRSKKTSLDDEIIGLLTSIITGGRASSLIRQVALLNRSLHYAVKFLYFLPMIGAEGAIGLFCYGSKKELSREQRSEISVLAHNILFPFISAYKSSWENQQIVKESIKSAISAIMSRNMSHNLGSHYLYYTKAHLDELANRGGTMGPDIRGAARVLSYIQARMDYLATIISNDKYPNGPVNFKSQIYDELTVDDFSKRHFSDAEDFSKRTTNFLLSNLVMSENFSRPSILSCNDDIEDEHSPLLLQVKLWDGEQFDTFTGSCADNHMINERAVKNKLSQLNLALPGGTMSCHAFFNILENFIRNSAKYRQEDFKQNGLLFTIAIRPSSSKGDLLDFVIFDNKQNANRRPKEGSDKQDGKTLIESLNEQLSHLRILDEDNGIDKASKGLKEMIFSSVWLRAYEYPTYKYADIIDSIHSEEVGVTKLKLIRKYAFSFVAVSDSGVIVGANELDANLGIKFTLPRFLPWAPVQSYSDETEDDIIQKCLNLNAEIVEASVLKKKPTDPIINVRHTRKVYKRFFPRLWYSDLMNNNSIQRKYKSFCDSADVSDKSDEEQGCIVFKFKSILDKRFKEETGGDIDRFHIIIGGGGKTIGGLKKKEIYDGDSRAILDNESIYFERHLNNHSDLRYYKDHAYADSISGGNFTITLSELFEQGLDMNEHKYKTWSDKLFGLKIKESALTRITIIDERLFNNMNDGGGSRQLELSLKNVRVLSFNPEKVSRACCFTDLFDGNCFRDNDNRTTFISIHLGLIEKMVKNDALALKFLNSAKTIDNRVRLFMKAIRDGFSGSKTDDIYISVHSGRGNFSKELEGPLAEYPFISLPAIENAFSNSKYLLAQLFYNTVYIGKGKINKRVKHEEDNNS